MKVVLANDWFAPNGHLYRKSVPKDTRGAIDMPNHFEPMLPSAARVVGRDEITPEKITRLINERPGGMFTDPEEARIRDLAAAQAHAEKTRAEEEARAAVAAERQASIDEVKKAEAEALKAKEDEENEQAELRRRAAAIEEEIAKEKAEAAKKAVEGLEEKSTGKRGK